MDGKKSQHSEQNICQCRCPCHFRNNEITESQPSNHAIAKVSKQSSRTAQITFSETIRIEDEATDSETSVAYNPFHVKGAAPAAAAFSKSFLHVKNIVKNMTARWESLAEPGDGDEDTSNKPKRYSLTARCVGPNCANPENIQLDWKRVSDDQGDQKEYHWKLNNMPDNVGEHEYSLEPLQSSKNVSELNKEPTSVTASNHQTFQTQTPTLQAPENSFQEDNSRLVDTASEKASQNAISIPVPVSTKESSNQTALSIRSMPIPPQSEESTSSFHSTNPFKPTDAEQSFQQKKTGSGEIFLKNELNMQAPAPLSPHSVKYEVKNIRKSFEHKVDKIVEKVNKNPIDSYDHKHPPTDTKGTTTGPSWMQEISFPDELKVSTSKVDDIITKSERAKENELKTNIGSESATKSKEVRENNIGDNSRADIYSFPVPHTEPAQSQMIGNGPKKSSYKKDSNDDLSKNGLKSVRTTQSLDWENSTLRRKSQDDYLPATPEDKNRGGSRPERVDIKRSSVPTYITSQSQIAKKNLRSMEYDEATQNCPVGVSKSIQSVAPHIMNDASIQTSRSICQVKESLADILAKTSSDPTKSNTESSRPQPNVNVNNQIKPKPQDMGSMKADSVSTEDTPIKMKEKNSNESISPVIVQRKENQSYNETHHKHDVTPLEMMAKIATANDEQDYATYMAWISVQSGCGCRSFGNKSRDYQGNFQIDADPYSNNCQIDTDPYSGNCQIDNDPYSGNCQIDTDPYSGNCQTDNDPNSNANMMYNETQEETSPDEDEEENGQYLNTLSKEYDDVVVTPSQLLVEPIGQSVSVSNTSIEMQNRCSGDNIHRNRLKECHSSSRMTGSTKSHSSSDLDKGSSTASGTKIQRSKREFYKCHKCHKIVASGEAAFYSNEEIDIAWHPRCFTCIECDKDLSQSDHSFFDEEPYCREHYVRVANIPKCSKCQQLIYDSTYTSAAGNSWHHEHFSCESCKTPLVDAKYVFVRNKHPYCFHCHESHFPKICNTCDCQIPSSVPFVQGGDAYWHSSTKCMHCSSCNGSLVGRTLFFRRGKNLYCNRYCALREM